MKLSCHDPFGLDDTVMVLRGAILLLAAFAMPLGAQHVSYRFPPQDTLRYQEFTETHIELRLPRGPVTFTGTHDATIALTAERSDTVRAWYEKLTLSSVSPQGEQRPATDGALRLPFRLSFTPTGRVSTASAPQFPADIAAITDLARQFEDFFISLPPSQLRPDVAWSDTVDNSTVENAGDTTQSRHMRRYRVLRDTVIAGEVRAVLIAVEQDVTFRTSSPMKNAPIVIHTHLEGREEGTAVFDPAGARLLSRVRRGHLSGTQVLTGEGREVTVPMTYEYSSSLAGLP